MAQRLAMIDSRGTLSELQQCNLLGVARSSYHNYLNPRKENAKNLSLMLAIDKLHLEYPYFGARRILAHLPESFQPIGIKRIRRLMRLMGITVLYQQPKTTKTNKKHKKYPYLLRNVAITHPNHVWCTDITYVPMQNGFMFLCAIMDWHSRMILSWRLSDRMTVRFCAQTLQNALSNYPKPDIFNSDQGSQFTSNIFTGILKSNNIRISMDGKGRAIDNVYIERFWRDIKYNCIYPNTFDSVTQLHDGIKDYIYKHCYKQKHSSLGYQFPAVVYQNGGFKK
mgnify:CR=1 FL=1